MVSTANCQVPARCGTLPYMLEDAHLLTSAEMETRWQAAIELAPVACWSGATR
jgi:hypothetical protein